MSDDRATPADSEKLRWRHRKRLEFIEFRLLWEGRVNRGGLTEAFDISEQQASLDLARYQKAAPGNLIYDLTERAYLRSPAFQPRFITELTDRFLLQLMAVKSGQIAKSETYFGELPSSKVAALPHQPTSWELVMQVSRAIRKRRLLKVRYASLSSSSKGVRFLAPHAFGYGSGRWHIRAWDEERNDFRDFALDRIEFQEDVGSSIVDPAWDRLWNESFNLSIIPNPALDEREQAKIAKQYGMRGGSFTCSLSLALCFYLIVDFNLDLAEKVAWGDGSGATVSPRRIHLRLQNWAEYNHVRREAEAKTKQILEESVTIDKGTQDQSLTGVDES